MAGAAKPRALTRAARETLCRLAGHLPRSFAWACAVVTLAGLTLPSSADTPRTRLAAIDDRIVLRGTIPAAPRPISRTLPRQAPRFQVITLNGVLANLGLRGSLPADDAGSQPLKALLKTAEFGFLALPYAPPTAGRLWQEVAGRSARETGHLSACLFDAASCASPRERQWASLVASVRTLPVLERIEAVNRLANALVPYRTDVATYGAADKWATLGEFLRMGGDCEDYAIAKKTTLEHLGIDPTSMRVVIVRNLARGEDHAVLSVNLDGQHLILDNLSDRVLKDTNIAHYVPVAAVGAGGGALYTEPSKQPLPTTIAKPLR